jgi:hypothetical protein
MSGLKFENPTQPEGMDTNEDWRAIRQFSGDANGETAWSRQKNYTGFTHASQPLMLLRNRGAGGAVQVQKSTDGSTLLNVTDAGTALTAMSASGQITSTVASGTAPLVVASNTLVTNLNADLLDGINAADFLTEAEAAALYLPLAGGTITGNLTVQGNTALGNADTDTLTVIGVSTYRNAANTLTQLFVDAANNRVIVGSGTALGSDTTPALHVVGRLYVAPESANDTALQIRRSSAATVGWTIGVENSPVNLAFKDDSDSKVFALGDAAHTYQAMVTGKLNTSNSVTIDTGGLTVTAGGITLAGSGTIDGNGGTAGSLRIGTVIVGAAALNGTEELRVVGQSRLEGALTVTTGGATIVGDSLVTGTLGVSGEITCVFPLDVSSSASGTSGGLVFYVPIILNGDDYLIPIHALP